MPDLPLADISLYYEVDGHGPPLLMLAGMLSDSASWGALAPLPGAQRRGMRKPRSRRWPVMRWR